MEELTSSNVEKLNSLDLVFVDYFADWCGPCMAFSPIFNNVAWKFKDKAVFMKCDADKEQMLAVKYGVNSIPCVMVYSKGKLVDKLVGLTNEYGFIHFVEKNLNR